MDLVAYGEDRVWIWEAIRGIRAIRGRTRWESGEVMGDSEREAPKWLRPSKSPGQMGTASKGCNHMQTCRGVARS